MANQRPRAGTSLRATEDKAEICASLKAGTRHSISAVMVVHLVRALGLLRAAQSWTICAHEMCCDAHANSVHASTQRADFSGDSELASKRT